MLLRMKRSFYLILIAALLLMLLAGCNIKGSETSQDDDTDDDTALDMTEYILSGMTLDEKIGQLFIIRPDALNAYESPEEAEDPYGSPVTSLSDDMKTVMDKYPPGGIIMFSKNISSPDQISRFNSELENASALPLFLCTDEEGGQIARLANHPAFSLPKYTSAAETGASGDSRAAEEMGKTIGSYLRRYGFNMDFAPVADVNTNPQNTIIGSRAFSDDPGTAALLSSAMASGLKMNSVIPVFKHFPGHGDTREDSHKCVAVTKKDEYGLRNCELIPFMSAGPEDCIMAGHIAVPAVTGDLTPSTMSEQMISGLLRGEMHFKGVIITDSLSMKAVTDNYSTGDACINAINAGCDILLMPYGYTEAFDAVKAAVESGVIKERRIDESVRRIIDLKRIYEIIR